MQRWTHVRFASAVVALTLVALFLSACGEQAGPSNADLLKQAVTNMKAAKTYTLDVNFNQAGQSFKLSGQVDVANSGSRVDIDAAGQKASLITIGSAVYLSTDGGTTFANEGAQGSGITQGFTGFLQMWNNFQPDQVDKHKDELVNGTPAAEKINGVDTKHIKGNAQDLSTASNSSADSTTQGTIEFWISTGTPYVRQMKIDGTTAGQAVQGTYIWDKFNEPLNIQAPPTGHTPNLFSALTFLLPHIAHE
jgi:hypothetical protein